MGTYDWLSVNPRGNSGSRARRRSKNNSSLLPSYSLARIQCRRDKFGRGTRSSEVPRLYGPSLFKFDTVDIPFLAFNLLNFASSFREKRFFTLEILDSSVEIKRLKSIGDRVSVEEKTERCHQNY